MSRPGGLKRGDGEPRVESREGRFVNSSIGQLGERGTEAFKGINAMGAASPARVSRERGIRMIMLGRLRRNLPLTFAMILAIF